MKKIEIDLLKNIKVVVFDVDGTLTDNGLYYSKNGLELKKFNVKDGMAISLLKFIDIKTIFLTSENSEIITSRAKKLKIDFVIQNTHNKLDELTQLYLKNNLSFDETLFLCDDINDLETAEKVRFSASPNDASHFIKNKVNFVSNLNGGMGFAREVIEYLFISKGYDLHDIYKISKKQL